MPTPAMSIWYINTQRMLQLIDHSRIPAAYLHALLVPNPSDSKATLANLIGPHMWEAIQLNAVSPLYKLAIEGSCQPGTLFIHQGRYRAKGFSARNRLGLLTLTSDVSEVFSEKKLAIEFSEAGLLTSSAYGRLQGAPNVLVFGLITEIEKSQIRASPFLICDLFEKCDHPFPMPFTYHLNLPVQEIDQFKGINFRWRPTNEQFVRLKSIPEAEIKSVFAELLGELHVQKDWGGEECDLFSSNLTVNGVPSSAAFMLKGPAKFHELKIKDCGKNGDQIPRLFKCPAEIFVVQHCHKISPAVREMMEAYAFSNYRRKSKFTIIDGYATACILHSKKMI
jgi:hypothetical protein